MNLKSYKPTVITPRESACVSAFALEIGTFRVGGELTD